MDDYIDNDDCLDDPKAIKIYKDIVKSLNEYPNDGVQSKFFLPENLTINSRSIAAAFVMSFNPKLKLDSVYNSELYSLFLLAAVCGMQIFLKERSMLKNSAPYKVQSNKIKTEKAQKEALEILSEKPDVEPFIEQVMANFFLKFLSAKENFEDELLQEKLDLNLSMAMLWGYFFAKEMIIEDRAN